MSQLTYLFLVVFSLTFFFISRVRSFEVEVKQGKLKGLLLKSRNDTSYYAFYGIPFAKPPVGHLRFEPPQEPDKWNGIRDAAIAPPECIQMDFLFSKQTPVKGQEDCLYLNVFTPAMSSKQLPVMVYIHGGGFYSGSANFIHPTYVMDHPVVVVVIQYRLGILGFLSTSDEVLPGNYGMKDQVAALKWVQQNIVAFGGDPEKVTIVGQSAGAASTHLHMYSPLSKGLFRQAISQSGSALASWAVTAPQQARERAYALGVITGCSSNSSCALLECLKELSAEEFVTSYKKFFVWDLVPVIVFSPVIEPKNVENAFLTENPWKVDVVSNVPWITGLTSGDGGIIGTKYLSNDLLMTQLNENYKRFFPLMFYYRYWLNDKKEIEAVTEAIRKFYFSDAEMNSRNVKNITNLFTDAYFATNCLEAARRHNGKTFVYYYDHRNRRSFNEFFGIFDHEDLRVCHCDDLISLFSLPNLFPNVIDGPDFVVSSRMVTYWVNFAQSGNPNGEENIWKPVKTDDTEYLHITTEKDIMESKLLSERYNFWFSILHSPPYSSEDFTRIKDEL